MTTALEIRQIAKRYGGLKILQDVSFDVQDGETFAIIGPNGAGKTTMFKIMTGEEPSDSGTVHYRGEDITHRSAHQRVRRGIGRTFQVARIFLEMSALENVIVAVESRRRSKREPRAPWYRMRPAAIVTDEAEALLADLGLARKRHDEARTLSHGDKKRLELAIGLGTQPSILMLDEPTAGMSSSDRKGATALIDRIRKQRAMTVVMTEHDMDVVFGMADRLLVLNYGKVIKIGTVEEVRDDPTVRDVYLGRGPQRHA